MKKIFTPLALLALLATASCSKIDSDDLDEDVPYYQRYEVLYDGSAGSTKASGSFRVRTASGTGITLGDESSLKINGNVATKDPVASIVVPTYTWNGGTIANVNFVLSKKGGTTITNTVSAGDIETVGFPTTMPTTFSKTGGIAFNYAGTAGSVDVKIMGTNSFSQDTSITKTVTANPVYFSPSELSIFNTGSIEIHLSRYKSITVPNSDDNAGGMIDIGYHMHNTFTLN
jgi:hypothetical protein